LILRKFSKNSRNPSICPLLNCCTANRTVQSQRQQPRWSKQLVIRRKLPVWFEIFRTHFRRNLPMILFAYWQFSALAKLADAAIWIHSKLTVIGKLLKYFNLKERQKNYEGLRVIKIKNGLNRFLL
jgi:hypothetical protein